MTFVMTQRGLSLPQELYEPFVNLLNIITKNEANCKNIEGGFCYLPQECSAYSQVFADYSFRIQFQSSATSLILPLASFVAPSPVKPGCDVYV